MRKYALLSLLLILPALLWADNALVLEKNELRITAANLAFTITDEYEDESGNKEMIEMFLDNVAGIAEYGISDNLMAALLFVPGVNIYSSIKDDNFYGFEYGDRISFSGMGDIGAGIKFRASESRFVDLAMSGGLTFPLDRFDLDEEIDNYCDGDDFRIYSQSATEGMGFTFNVSTDIKATPVFTLNVLTGLNHHFPVEKVDNESIIIFIQTYNYLIDNFPLTPDQAKEAAKDSLEGKKYYNYGTDIELEIEPRWEIDLINQSRIGFSLPLKYQYSPDIYIDDERIASSGGYIYTLKPIVSFMTYKHIPVEILLQYNIPVYGQNKESNGAILLFARVTLDL